jgi:hypothetical protein
MYSKCAQPAAACGAEAPDAAAMAGTVALPCVKVALALVAG